MVKMVLLHIALQEGFINDTVVILVNGQEVFHHSNVTTRLQIGYADSIEVNTQEAAVNVKVSLPVRNLMESIDIQAPNPVYLGLSVTPEGRITYDISHKPFGYF